jgi:hypothetical protein
MHLICPLESVLTILCKKWHFIQVLSFAYLLFHLHIFHCTVLHSCFLFPSLNSLHQLQYQRMYRTKCGGKCYFRKEDNYGVSITNMPSKLSFLPLAIWLIAPLFSISSVSPETGFPYCSSGILASSQTIRFNPFSAS